MEVCQHVNVSEHSILAALNWTQNNKTVNLMLESELTVLLPQFGHTFA